MDSPDVSELNLGLIEEAVVSRVESTSGIVRSSPVKKSSVIVINWSESVTEFRESKSEIPILVVSLDEEV